MKSGLQESKLAAALRVLSLLALPVGGSGEATADQQPVRLPEIQVHADTVRVAPHEISDDVQALPASVTVLEKADLDRKTITSYGDIFRGMTGVSLMQYGQGLVAYEIKARGFSSGHGRDLAVYLDGMPLNVTGSQHTNGYMDLAQLIPELISRVEFVRGPFSALAGNHAIAGSVQLFTDANASSGVKMTVDSYGQVRALPVLNTPLGNGRMLLAADVTYGDGYSDQSRIERENVFARYMFELGQGLAAVRFQAYEAEADAPGYLDLARIRSGEVSRRDALSRGIGDAKSQQNLVFNYRSNDEAGQQADAGWFATIYLNQDVRRRWTNYALGGVIGASTDLNQERDRLSQFGFDVRKTRTFDLAGMPSQLMAGVQFNDERIDARRFMTDARRHRIDGPGDVVSVGRDVDTRTSAFYAQYQLQPVSRLKLIAGLRYDHLKFNIDLRPEDDTYATAAPLGAESLSRSRSQLSPKLGIAWALSESGKHRAEIYANAARGLKSPYPFADYYANLGVTAALPGLDVSTVRSYEAGLQGAAADRSYSWRLALWNTRQDSEAGVNSVGVFESFQKTERNGADVEGRVRFSEALAVFGNYSRVHARSQNPIAPGADHITNVPEYSLTLGVDGVVMAGANRFDLSLADTLTGPQSLTADDASRAERYNRYTGRVAWSRPDWRGVSLFASAVYYDRPLNEVQFDFGGGSVGVAPRPRIQVTTGVQIPL
ncbi:TonB-dependent receptor [Methyloversatilis discipulorum]|uniref:TonB-dependent receptor n=1 Tax=Methyloversatilis discipulorum TaxID=1119528 RepID=UPI001A37E042|nr:TonB-dependent receptor [Methyloversatilis discipulorum]MBL8467690.1 TonB-dependent receptor [Methyloversatilis discipulorum]